MSPQHNDIQQQQSSLCSFGQCLLKVMFSFLFFSLLISLIPLSHFCFVLWPLICLLFTSSYRLRVKQRSIKHKLIVCCLLYYTGRRKCCCCQPGSLYITSLHTLIFDIYTDGKQQTIYASSHCDQFAMMARCVGLQMAMTMILELLTMELVATMQIVRMRIY